MDKDRLKGKTKDITGRVERQAGEWTDDKEMQSEGASKQVEGKVQNAWGNLKDKTRNASQDIKDRAKKEESRRQTEKEDINRKTA